MVRRQRGNESRSEEIAAVYQFFPFSSLALLFDQSPVVGWIIGQR